MGALGLPELLIILVVGVVGLGGLAVAVWAVVDIAGRSPADFEAIGSNRTAWLVGVVVASVACGLGIVAGPAYLVGVRPKLPGR